MTLAMAPASYADLTFTAVGVMGGTDFGYTYHQPASFTFTVSENTVYGNNYLNEDYTWLQQPEDPNLFTAVSGTGLTVTSPSIGLHPGTTSVNAGLSFGVPSFQLHARVGPRS